MKVKIMGIFICILLIATVLPTMGNMKNHEIFENEIFNHNENNDIFPGEFIVKFSDKEVVNSPSIKVLNKKHQVFSVEKIFKNAENTNLDNIYVLKVPKESNIISIINDYLSCSDVIYAEPSYTGELPLIPNDDYFPKQWALHNTGQIIWGSITGTPDCDIDAPEAWNITTGSPDIVIASVDTGIDYFHEDIAGNIWNNEDEIPNNGIDDDNNGYIDDIVGWDFIDNDNEPLDNESYSQFGHGTRCAGVHSAVTNNTIGLSGLCWNCKVMVIRSCPPGTQAQYAQGIVYAADNDADVINVEMGWPVSGETLEDAVNYAYGKGCYLVACAHNYNTSVPYYPAAYANVTGVGATNQHDERCDEDDWGTGRGSNWGDWVDVAAPGNYLYVLNPNDLYTFMFGGGTSVAAPFVAGLGALLLSVDPNLSPDKIHDIICDERNVDPYEETEYYIGTGRINAFKALKSLDGYPELEITDISGGLGVSTIVKNKGDNYAIDVNTSITITGGLLNRINTTTCDVASLLEFDEEQLVKTEMLFGLGRITITVCSECFEGQTCTQTKEGIQLLFFTIVK